MAIAVCITTPAAKDDPAGDAKPAVSVAEQMAALPKKPLPRTG